jgi:hypothetical protein
MFPILSSSSVKVFFLKKLSYVTTFCSSGLQENMSLVFAMILLFCTMKWGDAILMTEIA